MWEFEISQCENLKFHNVRTWNSQCENLKFHNVKTQNFTMWKPEISQCENLKLHKVRTWNFTMWKLKINVKTWNFTMWELEILQCESSKFHNVKTWNFRMWELEISQCENLKFTMWELEISVTYEQNNRNNHSQKTLLVFKPSIYRRQSNYNPMSRTEVCVTYCMAAEHMQSVIISTHLMLADLKLSARFFRYVLLYISKLLHFSFNP